MNYVKTHDKHWRIHRQSPESLRPAYAFFSESGQDRLGDKERVRKISFLVLPFLFLSATQHSIALFSWSYIPQWYAILSLSADYLCLLLQAPAVVPALLVARLALTHSIAHSISVSFFLASSVRDEAGSIANTYNHKDASVSSCVWEFCRR